MFTLNESGPNLAVTLYWPDTDRTPETYGFPTKEARREWVDACILALPAFEFPEMPTQFLLHDIRGPIAPPRPTKALEGPTCWTDPTNLIVIVSWPGSPELLMDHFGPFADEAARNTWVEMCQDAWGNNGTAFLMTTVAEPFDPATLAQSV